MKESVFPSRQNFLFNGQVSNFYLIHHPFLWARDVSSEIITDYINKLKIKRGGEFDSIKRSRGDIWYCFYLPSSSGDQLAFCFIIMNMNLHISEVSTHKLLFWLEWWEHLQTGSWVLQTSLSCLPCFWFRRCSCSFLHQT